MLFRVYALLFLLSAAVVFAPVHPASAAEGGAPAIEVDSALQDLGINATTVAIQPASSGPLGAQDREVVVFITYSRPFNGDLYLRGFKADKVEVARSFQKNVSAKAEEGGHASFMFDKKTTFTGVTRFLLTGKAVAPKPKPKGESIGDEISNTLKELVQ